MNWDHYQAEVAKLIIYDESVWELYNGCNLVSEAGEVFGRLAKSYRKGEDFKSKATALELGDVLWSIAAICHHKGWKLGTFVEYASCCDLVQDISLILCENLIRSAMDMEQELIVGAWSLPPDKLSGLMSSLLAMADHIEYTIEDIAQLNLDKLSSRAKVGKIEGDDQEDGTRT